MDLTDDRGKTSFHWAVIERKLELAELLAETWSRCKSQGYATGSLLIHEVKDGRNTTVEFMLQHGADVSVVDDRFERSSGLLHAAQRRKTG